MYIWEGGGDIEIEIEFNYRIIKICVFYLVEF